jgi:hypothetical protein
MGCSIVLLRIEVALKLRQIEIWFAGIALGSVVARLSKLLKEISPAISDRACRRNVLKVVNLLRHGNVFKRVLHTSFSKLLFGNDQFGVAAPPRGAIGMIAPVLYGESKCLG